MYVRGPPRKECGTRVCGKADECSHSAVPRPSLHGVLLRYLVQKCTGKERVRSPVLAMYSSRVGGIVTDEALMTGPFWTLASQRVQILSPHETVVRERCFGRARMLPLPSMSLTCLGRP